MKVYHKEHYKGHRRRIKEKFKKSGVKSWLDYEVLEFALTYAVARKDTKSLAKELIEKYKTFNGVLDADIKDISAISGISEHTALFLKLLKEVAVLYLENNLQKKDLLSASEEVFNYLKGSLKGCKNEELWSLFLDCRNQLISSEVIQEGTVNRSVVYPRKIVERALYHHAVGVIIAHNHPAGTLEPSREDYDVTDAIKQALNTVDIKLLDHIIVGGNSYFSFNQRGLL